MPDGRRKKSRTRQSYPGMPCERQESPEFFNKIRGLLRLVRLAGIEPTTPWFVAKYSIQLSYSREALDSNSRGNAPVSKLVPADTGLKGLPSHRTVSLFEPPR